MRVSSVTAHRVRIPFKAVFAHALHSRRVAETIVLVIESESGHIGVGEVLPRPYLTGETLESASQKEIPAYVQRWFGRSFEDCDEVVEALRDELQFAERALATFAGWELAVLDMAGKAFRFAAGDVLGPATGRDLEPGVVIDFGVPTHGLEKHCMLLRLAKRRYVKIKVGLDDDLCRLAMVQDVLGADHPLRLDANGAWTADYAIGMLRQMRRFNIRSIEQPVPPRDLAGMRRVREESGVPVVADESVCSLDDGQRLMAAHAADIFNIRIAKCGGFLACLRLVKLAHETGLGCQLGTLVGETGILSCAAEIFGRRVEGFEFLEGKGQNKCLLVEDIVEVPLPGASTPREGLGITIASGRLAQWAASTPTVFKS
jgi:L-alanine-DL-glutamate epimerase-like enolase superfamily enzyme